MEKLSEQIKEKALEIGFHRVGIVDVNENRDKQQENQKTAKMARQRLPCSNGMDG